MNVDYDDEALTLLSNPGTVRRAHKLVDAGDVHVEGDAVAVGTLSVAIGGGPPATWRCPCPAPGVCVHIVAAAIARSGVDSAMDAREGRQEDEAPGPATSDPRAELHALDAARLCRSAGIGAVRAARDLVEAGGFVTSIDVDGPRLRIRTREGEVLYFAGAGFAGMLSGVEPARRAAVHLAAVAEVRQSDGIPWSWPAASDTADPTVQTPERRDAATDAARLIDLIVARGTGRVVSDTATRLAVAGTRARAVGLPLLATELARCAGIVTRFAARDDGIEDGNLVSALARAQVLAAAIAAHPAGSPLGALRGRLRRDIGDAQSRELLPLGVRWWSTTTGARGLTAVFWDRAEQEIVQTRTARPAGVDAGFRAGAGVSLLWGTTVPDLLDGPFVLHQARVADDGDLVPDGGPIDRSAVIEFSGSRAIDAGELDEIAAGRGTDNGRSPSFTGEASPLLLALSGSGQVSIDEVDQHLIWPVTDAGGDTIVLRLPVDARRAAAPDALMGLTESRATIGWVLVHPVRIGGRTILEPSTVFVREGTRIRATALDFAHVTPVQSTRLASLRSRLAAALRRKERPDPSTPVTVPTPGPVAAVCREVLDVIDDVVVTGRRTMTATQRRVLSDAAQRADDLALALIASALRGLLDGESPAPADLLRTRHLAERALLILD